MRPSGREPDQMRAVTLERNVAPKAEGSCLVTFGSHQGVRHRLGRNHAALLAPRLRAWAGSPPNTACCRAPPAPAPGARRPPGKQSGRTQEIQRLIGRSLRAVVDMQALGENQITLDCDVLEADGGTRTASITGAYVALADAIGWLEARKLTKGEPLRDSVAAVSCGIYRGTPVLDLDYLEDVEAHTDANFVLTGSGKFVEIQGTAEQVPFSRDELEQLMALAEKGIAELTAHAEGGARVHDAAASCTLRRGDRLVLATHNAGKLREFQRAARAVRARAGLGRRARPARAGRDRHHLHRERPPQGACRRQAPRACWRWPTIPASRVDALGGQPGVYTANWAGSAPMAAATTCVGMRRVEDALQAAGATTPGRAPRRLQRHALPRPSRRPRASSMSARSRARWSGRRAATRASASIRCSCPTATTSPSARCRPRTSIPGRPARPGLSHRARAFAKFVDDALGGGVEH